ncbi:MAG: selenium-dependent molybdenum cofactor biosynthesis protein YqeB [Veillonellales bacterium]
MENVVLIKGGGDLATGVACRLFNSGFPVVITELSQPLVVRRTVSFAQAVFSGSVTVENITARQVETDEAFAAMKAGCIPVLIDPAAQSLRDICPAVVVDAILAKKNTGTCCHDAPIVIGLGPGFSAGKAVHAVVETMRGHDLGRVYYQGEALPNTGIPGEIAGLTIERLLRASADGIFSSGHSIGDTVIKGEIVGQVDHTPVIAQAGGILRGLLHNGLSVHSGMKIGDVDPRCRREHCFSISDKARAVAGGVLEAILHLKGEKT